MFVTTAADLLARRQSVEMGTDLSGARISAPLLTREEAREELEDYVRAKIPTIPWDMLAKVCVYLEKNEKYIPLLDVDAGIRGILEAALYGPRIEPVRPIRPMIPDEIWYIDWGSPTPRRYEERPIYSLPELSPREKQKANLKKLNGGDKPWKKARR